jgi:hypothetical protein
LIITEAEESGFKPIIVAIRGQGWLPETKKPFHWWKRPSSVIPEESGLAEVNC